MSVPQRTKAVSLRPGKCRSSSQLLQPDQAVANEAESCDTLLSQGIDLWQQLIGKANFSHTPAHAADSQASSMPLPVNAAEPTPDVPLSISPAQSMFSATDQPSHQKLQVKADAKSNMHGVSLQQLLAFVQLMQQHSSGSQTVHPAVNLQTGRTERQNADLDKLARVCSQNKQANMAYMGIGNSRVQQQSLRQWRSVHDRASGVSAHHAGKQQKQQPALIHKWQPRGELSDNEVWYLASFFPCLAFQTSCGGQVHPLSSYSQFGNSLGRVLCNLLSLPLCRAAARARATQHAVCLKSTAAVAGPATILRMLVRLPDHVNQLGRL